MKIGKATRSYEAWLARHTSLVEADVALKHRRMAEDLFSFLRATFYRWMQLWPEVCPDVARAPQVLAVGDLHVENFGTWRDLEGRLVWGVNDFDEVHPMPYTIDLVRLCRWANVRFLSARAAGIDAANRKVVFASRPELSYDVLSVGVANMVGEYRVQWNELMAAALIAAAPVMVLYALLERHLVSAITAGAVKG